MSKALTVGVVVPVGGGFFFGKILAGVARRLAPSGGRVVMLQSLDAGVSGDSVDATGDPPALRPVAWSHLDGVIVTVGAASPADVRRLEDAGIPVVRACVQFADVHVPGASGDNVGGMNEAVEHLLWHGHTRIGFAGNLQQSDMKQRYDTYRSALVAAGHPPDDGWFFEAPDNAEEGGAAVARALVASGTTVTALMFATDRNALGALAEFERLGVRVPRDLAIVGFDGIEAGSFVHPLLATVNQHTVEVAELATSMLLDRIAGLDVDATTRTSPSTFVRRGSCGCGDGLDLETDASSEMSRAGVIDSVLDACASLTDHAGRAELARQIARVVDTLVEGDDGAAGSTAALASFVTSLSDMRADPEMIRRVGAQLSQYVIARSVGVRGNGVSPDSVLVVGDLNAVLWREYVRRSLDRRLHLEQSLWEQYEVGVQLFEGDSNPTEHLDWLASTRVRAGCLAVWDGDPDNGRLKLVDVYDRDGRLGKPSVADLPIEQFPPMDLVDIADSAAGDVTFVIPVRSGGRDWGMLALVNKVDSTTSTGREQHSQWASLLAGAFAQLAMHKQIAASEERYGLAARATNDGMWDWDIDEGLVYFSERCNQLLGIDRPAGLAPLDVWLERLHPDDRRAFEIVLAAVVAGCQDPFDMEQRVDDGAGGRRRVQCRALPVGTIGQLPNRVVGSLADIEPQKHLEERLRLGALYDGVTGLPNRHLFLERLIEAIGTARRVTDRSYAVVFLDLDEFKLVNDSLGHLAGDHLLIAIADRLRQVAREADTAARFGGDEFAVLLRDVSIDDVKIAVERMRQAISAPVIVDGHEVQVTATFGIAMGDAGYTDPEDVLRNADIAMYRAKAAERGSSTVFNLDMRAHAIAELSLRNELRQAFELDEFEVHYQPLWSSHPNDAPQFEALVRWRRPDHGLQAPANFLPALIESGQMVRLGRWVIEEVCGQLKTWRDLTGRSVRASVNLSSAEFWETDLAHHLSTWVRRAGLAPGQLIVEITEGVISGRPNDVVGVMTALRAAGIELHIDNFGTGASTLYALYGYPIQGLKIDRSFVAAMMSDVRMKALVRAIVDTGRVLGLEVIAQGVEHHEQFEFLRSLGCDRMQGFALSHVLDASAATEVVNGGVVNGGAGQFRVDTMSGI